jgi:hypothetical protein
MRRSSTLEKWVRKLKLDRKQRASLASALGSGWSNTRFIVTRAADDSLTIWPKHNADPLHVPARKRACYREVATSLAHPPLSPSRRGDDQSDGWIEAMDRSD